MKRLGFDLSQLGVEPLNTKPRAPDCPGARLRISREEYDTISRGGERFQTRREDIPFNALGDARILCSQPVAQLPKTSSGNMQFYGLCHSCSGLEVDNRENLRARAKAKGNT